jgi:SPASM domain peptide maturase of grasp-with-spasm system
MNYYKIHSCCIPVKGISRAMICDLQRCSYLFLPNEVVDIIVQHDGQKLTQLINAAVGELKEIIDDCIQFLLDEEYIFLCDNPESFPKIDLTYETPEIINNAIIDFEYYSQHDCNEILVQLEDLGCKFLEIRIYHKNNLEIIRNILDISRKTRLRNIDFFIPFDEPEIDSLIEIVTKNTVVGNLYIFNTPVNYEYLKHLPTEIKFIDNVINESSCGKIHKLNFAINIDVFIESQKHNTCLNKKISINKDGMICNCPSMKQHYGKFGKKSLNEVINQNDFKDWWFIGKEQIDICQICEYRHICTDCRAFVQNKYDKPKKCSYNPHTMEWEDLNDIKSKIQYEEI